VTLTNALSFAATPAESLEILEQCVADRPENPLAGRELLGLSPWIFAVMSRYLPLGHLGRLEESGAALRQGIELAREHGDVELLGLGSSYRVIHDRWSGETATTLASARQGVEIFERTGFLVFLSLALGYLGDALRGERRYPEALEAYQKALDLTRTKRVGLVRKPHLVRGQAEAHSALGEHGKAIAHARSALEEALSGGHRFVEGLAGLTLARVLLATGNSNQHGEVERTIERAEACCEETHMRVYLPSLLEVRAALAERRGDPQQARRRLREAHRLYNEMAATGHAERLGKQLGL
jgi:tetratricopeptide (TPR) repeat protein